MKELRTASKRNLLTRAIFGAIGFSLGGVVAGSLCLDPGNPANPLNMGIMGAFGGAALGLSIKNWKKVGLLAITNGVGLMVGSLPTAMMIASGLPRVKGDVYVGPVVIAVIFLAVYGAIQGLIGVISLLIGLRSYQKVRSRPAIFVGVLGFAIAAQTVWAWALGLSIEFTVAIWGAIGGATLGAVLTYLQSFQHE